MSDVNQLSQNAISKDNILLFQCATLHAVRNELVTNCDPFESLKSSDSSLHVAEAKL